MTSNIHNVIIIPKGFRKTRISEFSNIKYFTPKLIHIKNGQIIKWINKDSTPHHLISGDPEEGRPDGILNTDSIIPGEVYSKKFESTIGLIKYYCVLHPAERGFIIIYDQQMNKSEIDADIKTKNYFDSMITDIQTYSLESMLIRHVDPIVVDLFNNPHLDTFRNKVLTIVFWDIGGFSLLNKILNNEPYLIVGFLRQFFNEANKIIHKNNGILDKFIGDGILAIFGFKNNSYAEDNENDLDGNKNKQSAIDAINSAIELNESFNQIIKEWTKIWNEQFNIKVNEIYLKCGINTGETLIGRIRTEMRDEFTVFGSNVNLASRLVDMAERNEILISENTKNKVEKNFKVNLMIVKEDHKIQSFENIDKYYVVISNKEI